MYWFRAREYVFLQLIHLYPSSQHVSGTCPCKRYMHEIAENELHL